MSHSRNAEATTRCALSVDLAPLRVERLVGGTMRHRAEPKSCAIEPLMRASTRSTHLARPRTRRAPRVALSTRARLLVLARLSAVPLAWFVLTFGAISVLMYSFAEDDGTRFKQWQQDLDSPAAERRQDALDRYALGDESWPTDVPCTTIVSILSAEQRVRDAAVSALARLIGRGECVDAALFALSNARDPQARALAAVVLGAGRRADRDRIVHELLPFTSADDSVAIAAIGALLRLGDASPPTRAALMRAVEHGSPVAGAGPAHRLNGR